MRTCADREEDHPRLRQGVGRCEEIGRDDVVRLWRSMLKDELLRFIAVLSARQTSVDGG